MFRHEWARHVAREVSSPLPSQDPMEFHDNTVISFTSTLRPALRSELTMDNKESQRVEVTHVLLFWK